MGTNNERGRTLIGGRWTGAVAVALIGLSGGVSAQTVQELWAPMELSFQGPATDEGAVDPNPFLDFRLQVNFVAPSGAEFDVPGFYTGDAAETGAGGMWKARFLPDELGAWSWQASFRTGTDVAIDLSPTAGVPVAFDGESGTFSVVAATAPEGFHAKGRLRYVDAHRLRFQNGEWFVKTGTDSPENLLGYDGFDGVQDLGGLPSGVIHRYDAHVADWEPGDPFVGAFGSSSGLRGIVGALNYLSDHGVNAAYFLPLNLGGDGEDTTPHLLYTDTGYAKRHFDVSRLAQWNTVFEHAMRRGIQLQFVLSETEPENEDWLDDGEVGVERKLFFRELAARFAHHNAIKWNLGEENDFGIAKLREMALYLDAVDAYDHPLAVHTRVDDFSDYEALLGDPLFDVTSIQYSNDLAGSYVEEWREKSAAAGRPWVLDMDENGTAQEGLTDQNAEEMRKTVLYDVLFSGGGLEWYAGSHALPLGGDVSLEDFSTREDMWRYARSAREVMTDGFAYWDMEPDDGLLVGESTAFGGGEVMMDVHGNALCYLPDATPGAMFDLSAFGHGSRFLLRWHDPRSGQDSGPTWVESGGGMATLEAPPELEDEDWVLTVRRLSLAVDSTVVSIGNGTQELYLDGTPDRAFHTYRVVTSFTGIEPGTQIGSVLLPLNWDLLTTASLLMPEGFGTGLTGVLDANGMATAQFDLSAELGPEHIGLTFTHAFLTAPVGELIPTGTSNAVALAIAP